MSSSENPEYVAWNAENVHEGAEQRRVSIWLPRVSVDAVLQKEGRAPFLAAQHSEGMNPARS